MKVLKVAAFIVTGIIIIAVAGLIYFNLTYPKFEPPTKIKIVATADKIERGKYLANHVAVCMDCHSTRDWNYYSAPIKKGTEGMGGEKLDESMDYPGTIYIRNITPAGVGNWTDGELLRAITTGINKSNEAMFPMMPYLNYNHMQQEDVESIIAYLRTLAPIKNELPKADYNFPFSLIVKTIPLSTYNPPKKIDKNNSIEYGKYLVTIASCSDCHTQSKDGTPVEGMNFAGGVEWKLPGGTVRTANITPDEETGIGKWTKDMFIARFKTFDSDSAKFIHVNSTKEFNTIMPWTMYAGMTEEDLGAIYDYLRTQKPVKNHFARFTPLASD